MEKRSGPRRSISDGLRRANHWTKDRLTKLGLVNAAVEPWGTFGRGWDVEKSSVATTTSSQYALIGIPKAWTPSTSGLVKKAVVYIKARSEAELTQYKGRLRAKIVVTEATRPPKPGFTPGAQRVTDEELAPNVGVIREKTVASLPAANLQQAYPPAALFSTFLPA